MMRKKRLSRKAGVPYNVAVRRLVLVGPRLKTDVFTVSSILAMLYNKDKQETIADLVSVSRLSGMRMKAV
jgi:hypothetical protein